MRAEIIAIGDELTSGQRLDTNSQWIAQQLGDLGVVTVRHTAVGDDLNSNVLAMQEAAARADIVICSGGLGPTQDDLTREAMAEAFQRALILDEQSLAKIRDMFTMRKREMPEQNVVQAMFPSGSMVIPNPHGSAPGIDLRVGESESTGCRFFALPGVPAEMKQMWQESVAARIEEMIGSELGPLRYHAIKVFGIGESDVEAKLPGLIDRNRLPTVGITVSRATITLRISGRANDESSFDTLASPTVAEINTALGDLVFGSGDDELQHVVSRLLVNSGQSLACVEIGAASWISDWMLAVNQASADTQAAFSGGIAFPSITQALRWLPEAEPFDSDEELWEQLAKQACTRFHSDIGLVVGVYRGSQEMESSNVAFDFVFAYATGDQVHSVRKTMGGHPDVLGPRVAKTGLDLIRRHLQCHLDR